MEKKTTFRTGLRELQNKNLLTIFASDCTGWGEEGPGIPGTLGTMVTGRTSYTKKMQRRIAGEYLQNKICISLVQWLLQHFKIL